MTDRPEAVLDAIVAIVVDHCDPDEVVLFGSWAKGTTHRFSDIDLLVIGPFRESAWIRDRELREAFREFPIAVDLHLLTPQEFAVGSAVAHSYLNTSVATSRTLYRRGSRSVRMTNPLELTRAEEYRDGHSKELKVEVLRAE